MAGGISPARGDGRQGWIGRRGWNGWSFVRLSCPSCLSRPGFRSFHEGQAIALGERAHRLEAVGFERALRRVGETRSFRRPRQQTTETAARRRTDQQRPSRRPENSPHFAHGLRPIVGVQGTKEAS